VSNINSFSKFDSFVLLAAKTKILAKLAAKYLTLTYINGSFSLTKLLIAF